MERYHKLFWTAFTLLGIVYFSIALFGGVISSAFLGTEGIIRNTALVPGILLFVLMIMGLSAIICWGAKKIYSRFNAS